VETLKDIDKVIFFFFYVLEFEFKTSCKLFKVMIGWMKKEGALGLE